MNPRAAVYRLYDDADRLLYVGASSKPEDRFKYHAKYKRWWPEVARNEVRWHDDRAAALRAEAEAIATERPLYNAALPPPGGSGRGGTTRRNLPDIARNGSRPTPVDMRSFRISDELWLPFRARAEVEGRTTSAILTEAMREYGSGPLAPHHDFTIANWPDAAEWARGHLGALGALMQDLETALGAVPVEWLSVAAWLASTHHAADAVQQQRVITGHILRRFADLDIVRARYRDTRHLSETVQAILAAHLPVASG